MPDVRRLGRVGHALTELFLVSIGHAIFGLSRARLHAEYAVCAGQSAIERRAIAQISGLNFDADAAERARCAGQRVSDQRANAPAVR